MAASLSALADSPQGSSLRKPIMPFLRKWESRLGGMPLIFSVILKFYKAPSECEESEGSPTISLSHTRSL